MVALSLKQFQTPIDLIDLKWVGKACFLKYVGGRRPFQWYRLALLIFYAAPLINLNSLGVLDQSCVHQDRKSTRLNSSHVRISYAVFCLKKKKKKQTIITTTKNTKPQNNIDHPPITQ